ncbi:B-cell receptor CD22-like [Cyprinodon tularosa]|uniref:B-cell receptor CD22-like n=1 Tax=Cyprinodon tularosa TaxID=77115 RepID=UPI0018E1FD3C|nr:B-cell receptor CD22-like [Cyprinodon tularosa]
MTQKPNSSQMFSGETITLTCEVRGGESTEWTYEWRRSGSVIHSTPSKDWTFNVSESSSGKYTCQCRSRDDWYSSTEWSESIILSVSGAASSPYNPLFPVLLIVGSVSGIIIIILLALLWRSRHPNDRCCIRLFRSGSSNQSSSTNQEMNQMETNVYISLQHATSSVYETIQTRRATGGERPHHSEENTDYANVKPQNYRVIGVLHQQMIQSLFLRFCVLNTLLSCGKTQDAVLTIQPNWSTFYSGESVTFICDMNEGAETDWYYSIIWNRRPFVRYTSHKSSTLRLQTSRSGEYKCCGSRISSHQTKCSDTISITVSADKPTAKLTAGPSTIPVGGSVTMSCTVEPSAGWRYRWIRMTSDTSGDEDRINNEENSEITVRQGGIYSCYGVRGNPDFITYSSSEVTVEITCEFVNENYDLITITFSNKVAVTQNLNSSQMFSGETITLTCEVQGGESTEWTYEWRRSGSVIHSTPSKDWTFIVSESSSGKYTCHCRSRDDWYSSTEWSESIILSVSDKPRAKLTAGPSTIPVGGSVTMSCTVEPSAGWRYRWFRRTSDTSGVEVRTNNEENREITVRQGGIYSCYGVRGNPEIYTHSSSEVTVKITFSNKVVVTQKPNRSQMFSGETITLTCEVQGGESTEWTYEWRRSGSVIHSTPSKDWTFNVSESSSGKYTCQCRSRDDWYSSTEWSESIILSVSADKPRATLTAGPTVIPLGGHVILSCSVQTSAVWKYRWFRRTSDTSEVQIGINKKESREITVRQGGIYRCEGVTGNPDFYTHSSSEVTVEITFCNKVAVTQKPNSSQMFSGETITLTCEVQGGESTEWTYEWRRSGSVIHSTPSKDWTFTVSESSSGKYTCQCRSRDDWYSSTEWSESIILSVSGAASSPYNPLFPVLLIVSGIIIIILLALLWRCRHPNDRCCIRLFRSGSSNQSSSTNHEMNQMETNVYISLQHATSSVYETIQTHRATGGERPHHSEENTDYANVKPQN